MSSAEKIIESIRLDSEEKIKSINSDAESGCMEYKKEADEKIKEIMGTAEQKIEAQSRRLLKAGESKIELEKRTVLLRARRREIDRCLSKIADQLDNLSDKDYFDFLYRLALTSAIKKGEIILCSRDLKRLPTDFLSKLSDKGINATLCSKPDESIKSGFILRDGDIEENMTLEAVINDKKEAIEDIISRELFKS